jgi:hypothetical protein
MANAIARTGEVNAMFGCYGLQETVIICVVESNL